MEPPSPVGPKCLRQRSESSGSDSKSENSKTPGKKLGPAAFPMLDIAIPEWPTQQADTSNPSSSLSACDFLLDIKNYIPVGCLRLQRHRCLITADVWKSCCSWQWLGHPREIVDPNAGPFLSNSLHEALFTLPEIQPYRTLHQAGWIRLEFKTRDAQRGQIRVYLLPDDIGRRMIDRADQTLRKSLRHLMAELDIAKDTWDGDWADQIPVAHIDSALDEGDDETSLFYLFNTLPSPSPDASAVKDFNSRSAMENILKGRVGGLKTNMMAYQRRSAAFMLQKESQPLQAVDPRLRKCLDQNGTNWYCDLITGACLRMPRMYETARGGICAETMGLGKTLICLSLILATRDLSSQIPVEYSVGTIPVRPRVGSLVDMSASTIGRTGTPWKSYFKKREQDGSEYTQCKEAIKRGAGHYYIPSPTPRRTMRNPTSTPARKVLLSTTTLIVVPANLLRQWQREIEKHTSGLTVLVMQKPKSVLPPAVELREYDVILFSRPRFEKEASLERGFREADGLILTKDTKNCSCIQMGHKRPKGRAEPIYCSGGCSKAIGESGRYLSPLRDLHFKRLITDEGHTMGNSSSVSKTNAVIVVDFLQISARWIVSGTPTQGLYGADGIFNPESMDSAEVVDLSTSPRTPQPARDIPVDAEQERKDLEKLRNIAVVYLKSKPWSNDKHGDDSASWSDYVMQPRHGSRSYGNYGCLQSTLEGMMIRHRPEDVEKDVVLPPLFQKVVYLEGSLQDKLSLNMFSLLITSNAVTSERTDADYLFHPHQRKALSLLVANLRQASFFWAGIGKGDVDFTVQLAKKYISDLDRSMTENDRHLLAKVIQFGETALANTVWLAATDNHEMPYYIRNNWTPEVKTAWALDGIDNNPTLMGSTQILTLQKFAHTPLENRNVLAGLADAGRAAMVAARMAAIKLPSTPRRSNSSKIPKKAAESTPTLAGGLGVMRDTTPKKKLRGSSMSKFGVGSKLPRMQKEVSDSHHGSNTPGGINEISSPSTDGSPRMLGLEKDPEKSRKKSGQLSPVFLDDPAAILSTASAKLSYLITQVLKHHKSEKIIIFYETENVAYYTAQALEIIKIEHLIYAKTLSSERRSQYIVTFNKNPDFRVLLMDISQAAFGLDVSAASRVYFINPPVNKQVEAQALKRAHRIGQFKPVHVETLVLRGSIEEVIVERKKLMSAEENNKCKTVLDDGTMYDWIKNVRFVSLPEGEISGVQQMAALEAPRSLFINGKPRTGPSDDPDAGLVMDLTPKKRRKPPIKQAGKVGEFHDLIVVADPETTNNHKRVRLTNSLDDDPFTSSDASTPKSSGSSLQSGFAHSNAIPLSSTIALTPPSTFSLVSSLGDPLSIKNQDSLSNGSKENSPSKAERSRLSSNGAKSLLHKLEMGASRGMNRRKNQKVDARKSFPLALPDDRQSENSGYSLNRDHPERNHEDHSPSISGALYLDPAEVPDASISMSFKPVLSGRRQRSIVPPTLGHAAQGTFFVPNSDSEAPPNPPQRRRSRISSSYDDATIEDSSGLQNPCETATAHASSSASGLNSAYSTLVPEACRDLDIKMSS